MLVLHSSSLKTDSTLILLYCMYLYDNIHHTRIKLFYLLNSTCQFFWPSSLLSSLLWIFCLLEPYYKCFCLLDILLDIPGTYKHHKLSIELGTIRPQQIIISYLFISAISCQIKIIPHKKNTHHQFKPKSFAQFAEGFFERQALHAFVPQKRLSREDAQALQQRLEVLSGEMPPGRGPVEWTEWIRPFLQPIVN